MKMYEYFTATGSTVSSAGSKTTTLFGASCINHESSQVFWMQIRGVIICWSQSLIARTHFSSLFGAMSCLPIVSAEQTKEQSSTSGVSWAISSIHLHHRPQHSLEKTPNGVLMFVSIIRLNQVEIYCFALGDSLACTKLYFRPNYQLCYLIWSRICIMCFF